MTAPSPPSGSCSSCGLPRPCLPLAGAWLQTLAEPATATVTHCGFAASCRYHAVSVRRLLLLLLLQERQYGADPADDDQEAAMQMQTDEPSSSGSSGFSGGHTDAELLARVQCSAAELKAALADRKALCIGACLPCSVGCLLFICMLFISACRGGVLRKHLCQLSVQPPAAPFCYALACALTCFSSPPVIPSPALCRWPLLHG